MLTSLTLAILQVATPQRDWQQHVHYTIEATLDEEAERLRGAATLVYQNRSPDVLGALYFHLHLNAFRPGSLWSRTERRPQYDFGSLPDPDHGFERLLSVRIGSGNLTPTYPHAPDSTVVRIDLPEPLPPGRDVEVHLAWEARPSTLCRRQCRQGRSYDFAHWYPRIAPYDAGGWQAHPLYPQGELYGEFGTYDVTLDLASDQVLGATGVPIEGDPGWKPGPGSPSDPHYRRSFYANPVSPRPPGFLTGEPAAGRKRVRFYAEDVHHFAWSTSPGYLYEGGRVGEVAVHALFRPGDVDWDLGAAVRRTERALTWLQDIFGPYPWPQLTNVHRLEGGGTEFPMVIMDGSPGQSLIIHETAHQYAHGILANNEWREAWLDEGMASFLTDWFMEEHGVADVWSATVVRAGELEARGVGHPVATVSEELPDFATYGYLAYTKPSIVLRMLREHLGHETFRRILRAYHERHRLQHVTGEDFQRIVEDVTGEDHGWFFDQWIRSTATLDYRVGQVRVTAGADDRWNVQVEVLRDGEAWMPVDLQVGSRRVRLDGREARQLVELVTDVRPAQVILDPDLVLLDTDRTNDRARLNP